MKQAVFFATLAGFLTQVPDLGFAQTKLTKEGFPLMFFIEGRTESYQVQKEGKGEIEQQHQLYTGTTLKPFDLAWFHLGMATKATSNSELQEMLVEPASLHFITNLQLVPNFVFVSGGMVLPLVENNVALEDSLKIYDMINGYSSLSSQNILPLNLLSIGSHVQKSVGGFNFKLGFMYFKPSSNELYSGIKNFPGAFMNYRFETTRVSQTYQRLEIKFTQFTPERDRQLSDNDAHKEGGILQTRYAIRFQKDFSGTEYGVGGAWQLPDQSRRNLAENRLFEEGENSNIQRVFLDWTWIQSVTQSTLLTANMAPQMLYKEEGRAFGYQLEISPSLKIKSGGPRFLKITATGILGRLGDENILGGMFKISYSFHRQRPHSPELFPRRSQN